MADDAELTRRVKGGDGGAVAELYRRHHPTVLAFSRRLSRDRQAAEDLANEAFTRTLQTVRMGSGGPSAGWRPYLCAVARNTAVEWARDDNRLVLTADEHDLEPELPAAAPEPRDELVVRAFKTLPERLRRVLWHTVVEDESPERVAGILGVTREHVNVLAHRAREGLRTAYLAAHVETGSPACREFAEQLAVTVRKPGRRVPRALREHLDTCASCARAHGELRDLNTTLRASLPLGALPLAWDQAAAHGSSGFLGLPTWAVPVGVAAAGTAVTAALLLVPSSDTPQAAAPPQQTTVSTPLATAAPTSRTTSSVAPTTRAAPTSRTTSSVAPTTRAAVPGVWIGFAGSCVGDSGGDVVAAGCADPGTAWRRAEVAGGFQLVNVESGRCLAVGENYDTERFNGTGMWAVRLTTCADADAQRWHTPGFSDGVARLVSVATGAALSVGEEVAGKPAPTAFILYMPYTGSSRQQVTLDAVR